MNYGYDETTPNWKENRKKKLAQALAEKLPCRLGKVIGGVTPYIEIASRMMQLKMEMGI